MPENAVQNQTPTAPVVVEAPQSSLQSNEIVEEVLNKKLPKDHILRRVAFCESTMRQFAENGSVLTGKVDPRDTGLFQINSYYHADTAKHKGMDLSTVEGNVDYAIDLYNREGTKPWNSSKPCWGKYVTVNNI